MHMHALVLLHVMHAIGVCLREIWEVPTRAFAIKVPTILHLSK